MIKFCNILIFKSIAFFIYSEIKIFFRHFKYLFNFFRYVSFFKYLIYRKKDYRILRDKIQKKTLKKNFIFWKTSLEKVNTSDNILITSLIDVIDYGIGNAIIGKTLSKFLNKNSVALIKELHFKTEIFIRSFGIDKIYYVPEGNIFSRTKYFFKSIKLIGEMKKTDDLLNLKYKNIDIGVAVYDHYLRFSGIGSLELINSKIIYFLSKALLVQDFSEKLFKLNSFKEVVQSEQQFIPSQIIFQNALQNKCKVFARIGVGSKISAMIYKNLNEKYLERNFFSKDLIDLVYKKFDKNKSNEIKNYINERFKGNPNYSVEHGIEEDNQYKFSKEKNLIYEYTKNDLCEKYNWDVNKPIVVLFANDLTDGVFKFKWKIFKDNLTGIQETLKIIKKIKYINWLIKPHPGDVKLKVITTTDKEVLKLSKEYDNIRLFPNNFGNSSLPNIISAAVTLSGSVGYEYPSIGIPSIICTGTNYAGNGFNYEAHSIKEYEELLRNAHKLDSLTDEQVFKAQSFIYTHYILTKVKTSFIPKAENQISGGYDDFNFWKNFEILIDKYNFQEDPFYKNFKIQLEKNDRHTINYNFKDNKSYAIKT